MTYIDSAGSIRSKRTGRLVSNTPRHLAEGYIERAPDFKGAQRVQPHKSSKPKGPPRWSHQRELEALKGQQIEIAMLGGDDDDMEVTLLEADQFTLKVRDDEGTVAVFFKHALVGYRKIEVKA